MFDLGLFVVGNQQKATDWPKKPVGVFEFEYIEVIGDDRWMRIYPVRRSLISDDGDVIFEERFSKIHQSRYSQ